MFILVPAIFVTLNAAHIFCERDSHQIMSVYILCCVIEFILFNSLRLHHALSH